MGPFGNALLVNGAPESSLEAKRGEVVRFLRGVRGVQREAHRMIVYGPRCDA